MRSMHARALRTLDKTQPPKELQSFPSLPQILSPLSSQEGTTPFSSILVVAATREIAPPLCCVFCNANSAGSYVTQRLAAAAAATEVGAPDSGQIPGLDKQI